MGTQAKTEANQDKENPILTSDVIIGRREQEAREDKILSPYACKSRDTRGREVPEEKCDLRTDFQRDRDRIIHSKSFRRLMHKTQVFIKPDQDHFRTRLTHTLEVAQIARTIARALGLNEDLTEAISLGHDLGHTPFGHSGEESLCRIRRDYCGKDFRHNVQSQRVVEVLEERGGRRGMNLTAEVRDGILRHTGKDVPSTLEGQVVRISDRIAYINHDIDDAIRAGIIDENFLVNHVGECLEVLGKTHKKRIDTLVKDIVINSQGLNAIRQSDEKAEALLKLRRFMFANVYQDYSNSRSKQHERVNKTIEELYHYYLKHPDEMPNSYLDMVGEYGVEEMVKDYLAGMTDRFAIDQFKKIEELK